MIHQSSLSPADVLQTVRRRGKASCVDAFVHRRSSRRRRCSGRETRVLSSSLASHRSLPRRSVRRWNCRRRSIEFPPSTTHMSPIGSSRSLPSQDTSYFACVSAMTPSASSTEVSCAYSFSKKCTKMHFFHHCRKVKFFPVQDFFHKRHHLKNNCCKRVYVVHRSRVLEEDCGGDGDVSVRDRKT